MGKSKAQIAVKHQMDAHISDYGWCRANMHVWLTPRETGLPVTVDKGVASITYRCAGCNGERHDRVSLATGELVHRDYRMPEGYILKLDGEKKPNKSTWRKEHFSAYLGRNR